VANVSSDVLQALGLNQAQFNGLPSDQQQQIEQIQSALQGLPTSGRRSLLSQVQGAVKQQSPQSGLQNIYEHIPGVASIEDATAHPQAMLNKVYSSLFGSFSSKTVGSDTRNALLALYKQLPLTGGGKQFKNDSTYADILGGVQKATQPAAPSQAAATAAAPGESFVQQYGSANTVPLGSSPTPTGTPDWATMTQLMGHDSQQAYQAYASHYQSALASGTPGLKQVVQTPQQWYATQVQNLQGAWAPLFQSLDAEYRLETGQQMPLALTQQLMEQIQGMDPTSKNAILAQIPQMKTAIAGANPNDGTALTTIAGASSTVTGGGTNTTAVGYSLFNTFSNYVTATTAYTPAKALQQNISSFVSQTGKTPTQDQINAISGMDQTTLQRYLDALPSPVAGVTMANYQNVVKNTTQLFQDNFGREPTSAELAKFAGWNPADIQRWVDSQPSKDNPGMTIGTRNSYLSMADTVSQKWFGTPADSRMVDALGGQFGTGAPAPAVPPPAPTQIKGATSSIATPAAPKVTP
jgi:hypothetical protein